MKSLSLILFSVLLFSCGQNEGDQVGSFEFLKHKTISKDETTSNKLINSLAEEYSEALGLNTYSVPTYISTIIIEDINGDKSEETISCIVDFQNGFSLKEFKSLILAPESKIIDLYKASQKSSELCGELNDEYIEKRRKHSVVSRDIELGELAVDAINNRVNDAELLDILKRVTTTEVIDQAVLYFYLSLDPSAKTESSQTLFTNIIAQRDLMSTELNKLSHSFKYECSAKTSEYVQNLCKLSAVSFGQDILERIKEKNQY